MKSSILFIGGLISLIVSMVLIIFYPDGDMLAFIGVGIGFSIFTYIFSHARIW